MITIRTLPSAPEYQAFAKLIACRHGREAYEVIMALNPGANIIARSFKQKLQEQTVKETGRGISNAMAIYIINLCIKCGYLEAKHSGTSEGRLLIIKDSPFRKLYPRSRKVKKVEQS